MKEPIGMLAIVVIGGVAVVFDLLSLIPFINIITNAMFLIIFGLFLFMNGVSIIEHREIMAIMAAGGVIGFIPFISMLPENMGMTALTIILTNKKRKSGGGGVIGQAPGTETKA